MSTSNLPLPASQRPASGRLALFSALAVTWNLGLFLALGYLEDWVDWGGNHSRLFEWAPWDIVTALLAVPVVALLAVPPLLIPFALRRHPALAGLVVLALPSLWRAIEITCVLMD